MGLISAVFWNRLKPENSGEFGEGKRVRPDRTVSAGHAGHVVAQARYAHRRADRRGGREHRPVRLQYPRECRAAPRPDQHAGADALRAAAQPDETANYLSFVASCEQAGEHKFTTFAEFSQYEQEYLACPKP